MKSTPILMTGTNVRGILEGRKRHTRRIIKPQPPASAPSKIECGFIETASGKESFGFCSEDRTFVCPWGGPGSEIWVRETFKTVPVGNHYVYRADEPKTQAQKVDHAFGPWKPSIFMPKAASRITLVIQSVRVERLQDISEEDATAEGCISGPCEKWKGATYSDHQETPLSLYKKLWEEINGPGSWNLNPFVWVLEFTRKEKD